MSHWNYRVMQFPAPDAHFAIHEVHYDDEGKPHSYSSGAAVLIWEYNVRSGLDMLMLMRRAIYLPVMTPDDFKEKP